MKTRPLFLTGLLAIGLIISIYPSRGADSLETWAERYVGTAVYDVAHGAERFVAVGDAFYGSSDGVCWTRQGLESPSINGLRGVAYGNGRFVAVESGAWRRESRVYASADGTTWQRTASFPAGQLPVIERVEFGGASFLAVGQEANPASVPGYHWLVMTSPDGVSWARQSGPTNSGEAFYLNAAAYGNGVYVVGGWFRLPAQEGLVLVSTNLTDWTRVASLPFTIVSSLAFGNGIFVAVGSSIATSPDGVSWTSQLAAPPGNLRSITFGSGSFVAVGDPQLILSSSDGVDWTRHDTSVPGLTGVTHGNGSFVAVGDYYTDHPRCVAVQSGGRPQVCLRALGFVQSWDPGFRLLLTAERGRTYRLQSSAQLPADSWKDVSEIYLETGYPDPVHLTDSTAVNGSNRFYRVIAP